MSKLIGKFIVFEGVMTYKFLAFEVVSETEKSIEVVSCLRRERWPDDCAPRRKHKASIGRKWFFDAESEARDFADDLNSEIASELDRHAEAVRNIFNKRKKD